MQRGQASNALNGDLRAALRAIVREIENNTDIRFAIRRAEGLGF